MAPVASISSRRYEALARRRTISVELPEFAIRALQHRADVANGESDDESDDRVSFNDVIEWYVISPLSVKELPHLEAAVPGFTGAFTKWLFETTYQPPEDGQ
jgi:hypothetical protein